MLIVVVLREMEESLARQLAVFLVSELIVAD